MKLGLAQVKLDSKCRISLKRIFEIDPEANYLLIALNKQFFIIKFDLLSDFVKKFGDLGVIVATMKPDRQQRLQLPIRFRSLFLTDDDKYLWLQSFNDGMIKFVSTDELKEHLGLDNTSLNKILA